MNFVIEDGVISRMLEMLREHNIKDRIAVMQFARHSLDTSMTINHNFVDQLENSIIETEEEQEVERQSDINEESDAGDTSDTDGNGDPDDTGDTDINLDDSCAHELNEIAAARAILELGGENPEDQNNKKEKDGKGKKSKKN